MTKLDLRFKCCTHQFTNSPWLICGCPESILNYQVKHMHITAIVVGAPSGTDWSAEWHVIFRADTSMQRFDMV